MHPNLQWIFPPQSDLDDPSQTSQEADLRKIPTDVPRGLSPCHKSCHVYNIIHDTILMLSFLIFNSPLCGFNLSLLSGSCPSFPLGQMDCFRTPTPMLSYFGVEASLAYPSSADLVWITKKSSAWCHLYTESSEYMLSFLISHSEFQASTLYCLPDTPEVSRRGHRHAQIYFIIDLPSQ